MDWSFPHVGYYGLPGPSNMITREMMTELTENEAYQYNVYYPDELPEPNGYRRLECNIRIDQGSPYPGVWITCQVNGVLWDVADIIEGSEVSAIPYGKIVVKDVTRISCSFIWELLKKGFVVKTSEE